ncbi:MAG: hypothetical protein R3E01_22175 [Pirellulaceae bacterium]
MDTNPEETQTSEQASGRPVAKFSGSGGLNVAVWKNKSELGNDYYSVKLERNYKDANGDYQSTSYLRDSDLLRAGKLLAGADEWIEQDKGRQRTQAGNPVR